MAIELQASTAAASHTTSHEQHIKRTDIRVNAIVREGGTGVDYGRGIDKVGGQRAEHVKISDKIDTEYRTNLRNIANAFQRAHPDLLSDPRFAKERQLIERISDGKGNVDSGKLDSFLSTDTGWALANGFVSTNIMMHEMALIAAASTLPPGRREMLMGGEGPFVSRIKDRLSNIPLIGSRITPDGENTTLSKGRGTIKNAIDAIGAFKDPNSGGLLKEGMRVRYEYDVDAFKAIMGEPEAVDGAGNVIRRATLKDTNMIEAIKALTNIDLNDYEVVGGQVRPKNETTNALQTGMSARKIEAELKELVLARRDFLENGCGVDPNLVEGSPSQWLRGGMREFAGVLLDDAVYEEYLNMGGLVDQANYTQNAPDFRRGTIALGTEGLWTAKNLRRYNEAYSRVLGREMENYVEELNNENNAASERFRNLQTLSGELAGPSGDNPGGKQYEAIRTGLDSQKQEIVNEANELTGTKERMDKLKRLHDSAEEAREALDTILIRRFSPTFFIGGVHDPQRALVQIDRVLTIHGQDINIDGVLITSIHDRQGALDRDKDTALQTALRHATTLGLQPRALQDRQQQIEKDIDNNRIFKGRQAIIDADAEKLQSLAASITSQQEAIQTATENLSPTKTEVQADIQAVQALPKAFDKVTDPTWTITRVRRGVPTIYQITETDLQSLSMSDLMKKANEIYENGRKLTPPRNVGWPKNRNEYPENQKMLLNAIVEAKARGADTTGAITGIGATYSAEFTNMTDPAKWNISEFELYSLSIQDLEKLWDERDIKSGRGGRTRTSAGPDNVDRVLLGDLKRMATERFNLRYNALNSEISAREVDAQKKQDEIDNIDFGKLGEKVDAAMIMADNQDKMLGKRDEIVREPGKYFSDQDIATSTETLTPAERRVRAPLGYLEMMDVFFDYKSKGAGREDAFKKAATFLPPKKLADYLNREFRLTVAPGADYEKRVFDEMQVRIKARRSTYGATTIDAIDMRRGLGNILNRLVDETIITKP